MEIIELIAICSDEQSALSCPLWREWSVNRQTGSVASDLSTELAKQGSDLLHSLSKMWGVAQFWRLSCIADNN